ESLRGRRRPSRTQTPKRPITLGTLAFPPARLPAPAFRPTGRAPPGRAPTGRAPTGRAPTGLAVVAACLIAWLVQVGVVVCGHAVLRLRIERQGDPERRAPAGRGAHRGDPAVRGDERAHDGQAEPAASGGPRPGPVPPAEP